MQTFTSIAFDFLACGDPHLTDQAGPDDAVGRMCEERDRCRTQFAGCLIQRHHVAKFNHAVIVGSTGRAKPCQTASADVPFGSDTGICD